MAAFSRTSEDYLSTCHIDIKTLFYTIIKDTDCTVICGFRGQEGQTAAFESGNSQTPWPESKHNSFPSYAVDVVPYNTGIDWGDLIAIAYFAGKVMATAERLFREGRMEHRIRWGGDWDQDNKNSDQKFNDFVHFELVE